MGCHCRGRHRRFHRHGLNRFITSRIYFSANSQSTEYGDRDLGSERSDSSATTDSGGKGIGEASMSIFDRDGLQPDSESDSQWKQFEAEQWLEAHEHRGLEFRNIPYKFREIVYELMVTRQLKTRNLIIQDFSK